MLKTILRYSLVLGFLIALGLFGCSSDTDRVTSPGTETQTNLTASESDWPDVGFDLEDYISQGYYYPEEETDTGPDEWDPTNPDDRFDDDNPSGKPLDKS